MRLNAKKPKDKAYPRTVKTLGDAIRKRRLDLGLRQEDVAKIIGCDKTSVLNWEKGHTSPGTSKISGVRRFLGSIAKRRVRRSK
ncbi:MAG: helix-turn-helix transcriptional regulator [Verrucomicrobiota bacterium]|nr:helix-turn-helix transcriptional regulator [Verrucomicrobiota bacterium]